MSEAVLRTAGLVAGYGQAPVVRNLDIQVGEREVVCWAPTAPARPPPSGPSPASSTRWPGG
jgi:hypothetical protein